MSRSAEEMLNLVVSFITSEKIPSAKKDKILIAAIRLLPEGKEKSLLAEIQGWNKASNEWPTISFLIENSGYNGIVSEVNPEINVAHLAAAFEKEMESEKKQELSEVLLTVAKNPGTLTKQEILRSLDKAHVLVADIGFILANILIARIDP